MSDLHIKHTHELGLTRAREITTNWINEAEEKYGMHCQLERTEQQDWVSFKRVGVDGILISNANYFEITAKLGFLFKSFLPKIKAQIEQNLDELTQIK